MSSLAAEIKAAQESYSTRVLQQYVTQRRIEEIKLDEMKLEYMLYHQVTPVVKGPVTAGKIKWRGIKIARDQMGKFIGVVQRGKFIEFDVYSFATRLTLEEVLLFGTCSLDRLHGGIINQINKENETN